MIYKEFPKFAADEEIIYDKIDEQTPDNWLKRNPRMIRLTGKHPFNAEPPLTDLYNDGYITSNALFYVRSHGFVPRLDWETHTVEVCGLVNKPKVFTMDELAAFPKRQFPVTFPCAGNRRREVNMIKQSKGFSWGSGGVSTSIFGGLMLRDLLLACDVQIPAEEEDDWHVHFEGVEMLPNGIYATSIAYSYAMNEANEVLMAYEMNGVRLPPDHGYPIRLLVPGIIGGRMVKWVNKIFVSKKESDNWYHIYDNRVVPSHLSPEESVAGNWWQKINYIINPMNINSSFVYPEHDEVVPLSQRTYNCRGYAYTGNGSMITRVELSLDDGESWLLANIDRQDPSPISKKYWAWALWSYDLPLNKLIRCKEIIVRAWDSTLNTQPVNITWNVLGQMNNAYFRLRVDIEEDSEGQVAFKFVHPSPTETTGWMAEKYGRTKPKEVEDTKPKSGKTFTQAEVSKHRTTGDCWIIVNKRVYDITKFVTEHPGGVASIILNAGIDCTSDFEAVHSTNAHEILDKYYIGDIEGELNNEISALPQEEADGHIALSNQYRAFPLIERRELTHDTRLLRFKLPSPEHRLGLPVGKHVFLKANIDGKQVMRSYTPYSLDHQLGYVDLIVKVYFKNVDAKFPNGGVMSQYLDSLKIGDEIMMKGPVGHFKYEGLGNYDVDFSKARRHAHIIGMIAGGSGITPILQVIKTVVSNPLDFTRMHLIYANRTPADILLREELDELAAKHPEQLKVWYTVDGDAPADWKYSVGYVDYKMCQEHLPPANNDKRKSIMLVCGPTPMVEQACLPNLQKMGYDSETIITF